MVSLMPGATFGLLSNTRYDFFSPCSPLCRIDARTDAGVHLLASITRSKTSGQEPHQLLSGFSNNLQPLLPAKADPFHDGPGTSWVVHQTQLPCKGKKNLATFRHLKPVTLIRRLLAEPKAILKYVTIRGNFFTQWISSPPNLIL